jgi:hypothetical protein
MSYGSIRKRVHEVAQPEEQGPERCAASDCPCRATVQIGGARWCCSTHAYAPPERWPAITEGLRSHDWLIAFTSDILRMNRTNEAWRAYALRFWDGQDDYCKPDPREEAVPYFNRMKAELDYRLGLCKRPAPRIPEEIGRAFHEAAMPAWKKALAGMKGAA